MVAPDQTVYSQGLSALNEKLGPTATLRFLALLSHQPFDYQPWRDEEFGRMAVDDLLSEAKAAFG